METPDPIRALRLAVDCFGSQSAMSRKIDVTQQAISKWLAKQQPVPPEHVLKIEAATGVSRHDLRPDIYPRESVTPAPPVPASLDPVR